MQSIFSCYPQSFSRTSSLLSVNFLFLTHTIISSNQSTEETEKGEITEAPESPEDILEFVPQSPLLAKSILQRYLSPALSSGAIFPAKFIHILRIPSCI